MRIIYGICSEGMGHTTRSDVVIEDLERKGHEVHIMTCGRCYEYMASRYKNVYEIKGFHLVYNKDKLRNLHSFLSNFKSLPKDLIPTARTLFSIFYKVKPNVVLSDFEFFTSFVGKQLKIPVISVNNISMLNRTKLDIKPLSYLYSKVWAILIEQMATFEADHYVIPTFFEPKSVKRKVTLTPPVVRRCIMDAKPTEEDHVVVYHTTPKFKKILKMIKGIDTTFHIYGFGKLPDNGNLRFHEFSTDGFVKHLASCKAVIIGGGFSMMSEAIYLKKPIYSVPLRDHFEQITNGHYLQLKKFGEYSLNPDAVGISDFLLKLPFYKHYLEQYDFNPMEFVLKIEEIAEKMKVDPKEKNMAILKSMLKILK